MAIIGTIAGMMMPFVDNYLILGAIMWVYLFIGGCILPLLTLCILEVIEPELRPPAYAIANFIYNLLGYLPAPGIYGLVCDYTGGKSSRWGLIFTMLINFPAVLFIGLSIHYKKNTIEFLE